MRTKISPLALSAIIYTVGVIVGFCVFNDVHAFPTAYVETDNKHSYLSYESILITNLMAILILVAGFGVTTTINLIFNGTNLTFLYIESLKRSMHFGDFLLLTLPHAIFEIPAIIIAGAAGFKIPYEIVRYLAGRKEQILTKEDIKEYLTLALISIILIVIAAWIEANVTLKIAKAMLNSTKGI